MKKILFVVLFFASLAVTAQRPFKITNSVLKLIWGGDSVVCTLTGDSVYFTTSQGQYVFDKSVILGDDLTIGTYLLSTSDTVAVIENGTVKYRLIGTISGAYADSAAVSYFSDTSENCYICDSALNANRWQTWDTAYVIGIIADSNFWKLTGNKLEPKVSTNYINTDSSYYIKGIEFIKANHNLGNQFIGVGSGMNNIVDSIAYPPYGYLGSLNTANGYYSLHSNTTGSGNISNGAQSLYSNTTGSANVANGFQSLYSNTTGFANIANGAYSLYSNTTGSGNIANGIESLYSNTEGSGNIANGYQSLYSNTVGSGNIAIGYNSGQYADTAANGLLWIGEGDYNNAIIYGNMLTDSLRLNANVNVGTNLMVNQSATIGTDLTVHGEIINGGLINKDTVLILADDATFNFPISSVGWAEIQCDSSLIEKTWGNVSWNGDGATSLRNNGAKFVNTDIDGNYACFYDGGSSYAILKNTSGYTQTYSIKYHYHY